MQNPAIPEEKKLTFIFRVEPGCLGPNGDDHIESFCQFAQKEFSLINPAFLQWQIIPREDKSLPEMEYRISNKSLSSDRAAQYLTKFDKNIDDLEAQVQEILVDLITDYLNGERN